MRMRKTGKSESIRAIKAKQAVLAEKAERQRRWEMMKAKKESGYDYYVVAGDCVRDGHRGLVFLYGGHYAMAINDDHAIRFEWLWEAQSAMAGASLEMRYYKDFRVLGVKDRTFGGKTYEEVRP